MANIMIKSVCLIKFFDENDIVVYQFVIRTCRPVRALDIARAWLSGNNSIIRGVVVAKVECELLDVKEVEY